MTINWIPPVDPTNLKTANYNSTGILNNIFNLLLQVSTSLQNVASAQSEHLKLFTDLQKNYTNLMAQVHTFMANTTDWVSKGQGGKDDNWASETRNDLNRLNSTYTQMLQNRQSVVSDDAKALQSNISQSTDAVNQQNNLGISILQQISSLVSSIYR